MNNNQTAESNLYQLKKQLAGVRAVAEGIEHISDVVVPDRSTAAFRRQRPLRSGCAIGPKSTSYGTLGAPARVTDPDSAPEWMRWSDSVEAGEVLFTTNRHVLDGRIGSPVYQPGHRTSDDNRIGGLVGFAELENEHAPDVAFIRLDPAREWDGYLDADGMGASVYRGDGADLPGTPSRLAGATSGTTTGEVQKVDRVARVNYGAHGVIPKRGVYRASDNSQGGDSGAPSDGGSGGDGAIHGLNFASTSGFDPAGTEGRSWRVPVRLTEECGVRVLSNSERESMSARNRDGHIVAIEGQGPRITYRIDAGQLWHSDARGATTQPNDEITGEQGAMTATGSTTGGTDAYRYTGARTVSIEREDGGEVTSDDVTVWVKPSGKDWLDWTEETLSAPGEEPDPHPPRGSAEWTPRTAPHAPGVEERPTYGIVDRARRTVESRTRTIRVDMAPWAGDDSADELGSLQAAHNYEPASILHDRVFKLEPGRHDDEPGDAVTAGDHEIQSTRGAHLKIAGDPHGRSVCVIDVDQYNVQSEPGVPRSMGFKDLTFRGKLSAYGGRVGLSNVDMTPGRNDEGFAIGGYGGTVVLNDFDYHDAESLGIFKNGKRVEIVNGTVDVSGPLVRSGVGGGRLVIGAGVEIDADRLYPQGFDAQQVVVEDPHGALEKAGLR